MKKNSHFIVAGGYKMLDMYITKDVAIENSSGYTIV